MLALKIISTFILAQVIAVFCVAGSKNTKGAGCLALAFILMLLFVVASIWVI